MASGEGHIDAAPPLAQEAYVLYGGGVVGGPDQMDRFYDIRSAMARDRGWRVYIQKPGGKPCDDAFPCHSSLSTGAKIALGVVLSIFDCATIIATAWYYRRLKGHGHKHWDRDARFDFAY